MNTKRQQLIVALSAMGVTIVCTILLQEGAEAQLAMALVLFLPVVLYLVLHAVNRWWPRRPVRALLKRCMDAAATGDTEKVIEFLRELQKKRDAPFEMDVEDALGTYSSAELDAFRRIPNDFVLACRLTCMGCESGHPHTAQAVLDHLGYRAAILLREKADEPMIPRRYAKTHAFLQQTIHKS